MLIHSPALSDQFARLRIAAQAQETRAWIPTAVQALITAILVRLFSRLEQMLLLWQSGTLPSRDTPNRAAAVAPRLPGLHAPRHRPARRIARRISRVQRHQRTAAPWAIPVTQPPNIAHECTLARSKRPHSARAPPCDRPSHRSRNPPLAGSRNRAHYRFDIKILHHHEARDPQLVPRVIHNVG